jgi:DNA repair exonuclease SbcCD ATPase subunit
MSQIVLQKLTLRNFKGLREFVLQPYGKSISVYGANATGKTTLMDGFLWCMFGKDSLGQAAFEVKPLAEDGSSDPGLDHEVEVVLSNGEREVTFGKVLREKWVKKRGEAERQFTGHEMNHFVDGVPVQKRQYDEAVSKIADERYFRLLANPRHFNEALHWEERRRILLDVCGDVSDSDVIEAYPDLADMPEILSGRRVEDHMKVLKAKRTEGNKALEEIPVRIDEAAKSKGQVANPDPKSLRASIVHLEGQKADLEAQITQARSGGEVAEKTKRLRELEAALIAHDNEAQEVLEELRSESRIIVRVCKDDIYKAQTERADVSRKHSQCIVEIDRLNAQIQALRDKWNARNAEQWQVTVRCPTCGQSLPDDQIREARGNWNQQKAEDLKAISAQGKKLAAQVGELDAQLRAHEEAIGIFDGLIAELQVKAADVEASANEIHPPADDPKRSDIVAGIEILQAALSELAHGSSDGIAELQARADGLAERIAAGQASILQIEANEKADKRIADLKRQERKLSQELADIEKQLFLCEGFTKAKVELLEAGINHRFDLARFRLFKQNINGGIEPCCETVVGGVPYGSLNNAMRINVGIDIANTLSLHYGVALPLWVDNAEAVNDVLPSDAQQIKLYVSDHDTLTIGG